MGCFRSLLSLALACCLGVWGVQGTPCTPDQWEGVQAGTVALSVQGHPSVLQQSIKLSYDAKNLRMATNISAVSGSTQQVVDLYSNNPRKPGRSYSVDLATGKCQVSVLDTPFKKICVPADAKSMGDVYVGLKGKGGLLMSVYNLTSPQMNATYSFSKLGDDVIPIGETIWGSVAEVPFFQTGGFLNITQGIADASVFDVPAPCKKIQEHMELPVQPARHPTTTILGF